MIPMTHKSDKQSHYMPLSKKEHVKAIVTNGTNKFIVTGIMEDVEKDFEGWKIIYIKK